MIIDNTDFDWTLSSVDSGTKPHVGLRAGDPIIAYMLECFGDAGSVRVVEDSGGSLGAPQTLPIGYHYGPLDVAVSQSGTVGVAYHNHDCEGGAVALSDGAGWEVSRVSHVGHDGWDTSISFVSDGTVRSVPVRGF